MRNTERAEDAQTIEDALIHQCTPVYGVRTPKTDDHRRKWARLEEMFRHPERVFPPVLSEAEAAAHLEDILVAFQEQTSREPTVSVVSMESLVSDDPWVQTVYLVPTGPVRSAFYLENHGVAVVGLDPEHLPNGDFRNVRVSSIVDGVPILTYSPKSTSGYPLQITRCYTDGTIYLVAKPKLRWMPQEVATYFCRSALDLLETHMGLPDVTVEVVEFPHA